MNKMSIPESNKRKSLDAIRVYAPSRGNLAIKEETLPQTHVAEPSPRKAEPRRQRPRLVPKAPAKKRRTLTQLIREFKVFPKLAFLAFVLTAAFCFLFMLSGSKDIAAAQKDINDLQEQISDLQSVVDKTNVDYLFSIDISSARGAAAAAGMAYPVSGVSGR
jgi:cell division protein FtsL